MVRQMKKNKKLGGTDGGLTRVFFISNTFFTMYSVIIVVLYCVVYLFVLYSDSKRRQQQCKLVVAQAVRNFHNIILYVRIVRFIRTWAMPVTRKSNENNKR